MSYLAPSTVNGRQYLAPASEPAATQPQGSGPAYAFMAPGSINGVSYFAAGSTAPQALASVSGGGAGNVRAVREFAHLLDKANKPTRSQKKARRQALEAEALELLPDLPEAEKLAPIAARIVYEQEARALAPLYANRQIQALAPVEIPFDAHEALRQLIDKLLAEAALQQEVAEDEENDVELLLFGT